MNSVVSDVMWTAPHSISLISDDFCPATWIGKRQRSCLLFDMFDYAFAPFLICLLASQFYGIKSCEYDYDHSDHENKRVLINDYQIRLQMTLGTIKSFRGKI
ncbi:hypothetical protein OESDEN_04081 [Oesophagostomum dentatum]|uniref:Uncharacterized protein n=1 Tax=Oesophagostomum dentatum TaxID=61180 RepID=A0A0B1TJF7_OESDE|nr:hypothetical protein OESDEN_04081 [Oesophagostomum dentatum]